ncbi:uncharacterized protein [Henckelia pumila]|uniref:uncharacterized protein n=1 Tax=Henckelia pumila TaxID=405737 RepID=UPI003C6DFF04
MENKKEGRPGEARTSLRRSVMDNGFSAVEWALSIWAFQSQGVRENRPRTTLASVIETYIHPFISRLEYSGLVPILIGGSEPLSAVLLQLSSEGLKLTSVPVPKQTRNASFPHHILQGRTRTPNASSSNMWQLFLEMLVMHWRLVGEPQKLMIIMR